MDQPVNIVEGSQRRGAKPENSGNVVAHTVAQRLPEPGIAINQFFPQLFSQRFHDRIRQQVKLLAYGGAQEKCGNIFCVPGLCHCLGQQSVGGQFRPGTEIDGEQMWQLQGDEFVGRKRTPLSGVQRAG